MIRKGGTVMDKMSWVEDDCCCSTSLGDPEEDQPSSLKHNQSDWMMYAEDAWQTVLGVSFLGHCEAEILDSSTHLDLHFLVECLAGEKSYPSR